MDDMTLLHCIKGQPQIGLMECLKQYKKEKLVYLALEHRLEIGDKLTANQLRELISQKLLENFEKDLMYLSMEEIHYINSLRSELPVKTDDVKYLEYRNLCGLGYVFLFYYEEHVYSVVPKELHQFIPVIDSQDFKEKSAIYQQLYNYVMVLLNLYGVYPVRQLVNVWNLHNKVKLTYEEVYAYVDIWT